MDQLFEWIINHDEVTLLCCPSFLFLKKIKGLGIDVESINYDINFRDIPTITCKDFVFDDVTFKDCVVNYNCENSYHVGKLKSELTLILKGDDKEHNGDCNPIKSIDQLIEQNNITDVYDSFVIKSRNKKYNQYCVYGSN